jgi:hypothetical protein
MSFVNAYILMEGCVIIFHKIQCPFDNEQLPSWNILMVLWMCHATEIPFVIVPTITLIFMLPCYHF